MDGKRRHAEGRRQCQQAHHEPDMDNGMLGKCHVPSQHADRSGRKHDDICADITL